MIYKIYKEKTDVSKPLIKVEKDKPVKKKLFISNILNGKVGFQSLINSVSFYNSYQMDLKQKSKVMLF